MTRFDAHIHLFKHGFSGDRPADAEIDDYLTLRAQHDIGRALVIGYEGDSMFDGNNAYVRDLAVEHDWIVPLHFLDASTATAAQVDAAIAAGAAGFSLYPGADPSVTSRIPTDVWRAISAHSSLLSINAAPPALERFAPVAEALGDAPVLVSHLGLPGPVDANASHSGNRTAVLTSLAEHPNVIVKLSGFYAVDSLYPHGSAAGDVTVVLRAFGPDRVVWGSDFSPGLNVVSEVELFTVPEWLIELFNAQELTQVLGGTLQRIVTVS